MLARTMRAAALTEAEASGAASFSLAGLGEASGDGLTAPGRQRPHVMVPPARKTLFVSYALFGPFKPFGPALIGGAFFFLTAS